ncbi:unnamed protein product [Ambrosiozyma monospora]|uniref:Unnamed protein product n=1 Tax=Ambrosiozyma monospora TaxID=43982 RepID=A0A9W6YNJ8_AMBMO|nr:unnamed protein product [Ambrosiozyma monospora]
MQMGTATPSISSYVALVENHVRQSTKVKSTLHSAGTTLSGEWSDVMELIGEMHELCHKSGVVRIHSDIRIGTRIDKDQTPQDKIDVVERKIEDLQTAGTQL